MAIANTGAISFDTIQTEFGGTNPISLDEYYAGGSFVAAGISGTNGAVPSSGAISMNQFYGTAKPPPAGQQAFTAYGTYSWVAPAGVTSVSAVAVGPGRGIGGGLGYRNNISVTGGSSYTVVVGRGGGVNQSQNLFTDSYFIDTSTVRGGNGAYCNGGGTFTGDGGGNGGRQNGGPAGGAGGYSGNGGDGAFADISYGSIANRTGSPGAGGGGGGGGGSRNYVCYDNRRSYNGGGGGVGLLGQGSNGAGGIGANCSGGGGGGGSGGGNGGPSAPCNYGQGGLYGGGGRCNNGTCGNGAVRLIWPGTARQFPSTRTANE
jgi:hypothetical protein